MRSTSKRGGNTNKGTADPGYSEAGRELSTCIRQHTSAYVSIRQHTSAYGLGSWPRTQHLPPPWPVSICTLVPVKQQLIKYSSKASKVRTELSSGMVAQPVMATKLKFLNCSGDRERLFEDGWPRAALKARTRKLRAANCPPRGLKTVYAKAKGTPSGIKSSLLSLCQYLCQFLYFCTSKSSKLGTCHRRPRLGRRGAKGSFGPGSAPQSV
jgi:hypothetical protein